MECLLCKQGLYRMCFVAGRRCHQALSSEQTEASTMEVVPLVGGRGGGGAGGGTLPFAHRDVQEWSRLDRLTGTLEHARVETDRWAARSATASHQYGKVRPANRLDQCFLN